MRVFCFPSTRWEINTYETVLDLDGRGRLLANNPRRILAIFSNQSPGAVGIFHQYSPDVGAITPISLTANSFIKLAAFDYGDVVGEAWFGVGAFSDVITATEFSPTPNSPAIELAAPNREMPTLLQPAVVENLGQTTQMVQRKADRIALIFTMTGGQYRFGIHPERGPANAIIVTSGPQTLTLLFDDYGPLLYEPWWGTEFSGSGVAPAFWEVLYIPEPACPVEV